MGEIFISSQDMSPQLEVTDGAVKYNFYDNGVGKMIEKEIKIEAFGLN